jgi:hypothetical protein
MTTEGRTSEGDPQVPQLTSDFFCSSSEGMDKSSDIAASSAPATAGIDAMTRPAVVDTAASKKSRRPAWRALDVVRAVTAGAVKASARDAKAQTKTKSASLLNFDIIVLLSINKIRCAIEYVLSTVAIVGLNSDHEH